MRCSMMKLDIQPIQNRFWASHFWKLKHQVVNSAASWGKKLNAVFIIFEYCIYIYKNYVYKHCINVYKHCV